MNFYDILFAKKLSGGGGAAPTGTLNISANGRYDVTQYAEADVNVPSGASNFECGTFTVTGEKGEIGSVDLDYSGNGYPIALIVRPKTYSQVFSDSEARIVFLIRNSDSPMTYNGDSADAFVDFRSGTTFAMVNSGSAFITPVDREIGSTFYKFIGIVKENNALSIKYHISANARNTYGLGKNIEYDYYVVYSE